MPFWECQFELAEGTIDNMNKILIISDKNSKSSKIKKQIITILRQKTLKNNIIIVIGGDGFMLQTLKNNKKKIDFFTV